MSNKAKQKKTLLHFISVRILVPLIVFVLAVMGVYYFAFYDKNLESDEQPDALQISAPVYDSKSEIPTPNQGTHSRDINTSKKPQNQSGAALLASQAEPEANILPAATSLGSNNLELCVLFSDFIVRARMGLPFDSALFHLYQVLKDKKLKEQLKKLAPYSEQGIGAWTTLMADLDKIVDRGVRSKARQSDPWIIKLIKSFVNMRKKSELTPLLRESIAQQDWPESYRLLDKMIEQGFRLKRWKKRLQNYVQGHVLLNSFFITYQASPLYTLDVSKKSGDNL
ncbi:MAG: hypothetical protein CMM87_00675 [Rickettsiales bacterium]|nr:hypothetical protein [Rickettsiales bacterium]|tara:strand:+ start:53771 stop:54616 length:846 start_codon:yes stop_codon:yes gene_type:complete